MSGGYLMSTPSGDGDAFEHNHQVGVGWERRVLNSSFEVGEGRCPSLSSNTCCSGFRPECCSGFRPEVFFHLQVLPGVFNDCA